MPLVDGLIKETLFFTAQKGWTLSHQGFISSLVTFLAQKLEVEFAMVAELLPGGTRARTVALYANGNLAPNIEYDLAGTPCENVMNQNVCCHPRGIQALFPRDTMLVDLGVEGYVGAPLWASGGGPLGVVALMAKSGIRAPELAESVLQIVAVRCAHELERKNAEEERRRLEVELLRFQKLESVGRLAAGVAHDMNNVLAAIIGVAEVMKLHAASNPEDVGLILDGAHRGRTLVKGLSDFSRQQLEDPRPLDLNAVLQQEAQLLRRTTLQRVEVVVDVEDPLPPVRGEHGSISNVLMNLCINAVHAMPSGGRLTLRSRRRPNGVEVTVEDTGHGMSPDVLARALDPFFTTKPLGKGSGLGLSIAFGTMKAHGGDLRLESTPGVGTRVTLDFPAAQASGDSPLPERPASQVHTASLDVLVVDDDDLVRGATARLVDRLGHRVIVAGDGAEALRIASDGAHVDIVLLDQNMPGMTGAEVLTKLRARWPTVPIVVTSGLIDDHLDQVRAGASHVSVLAKPFSRQELEAAIREAGASA